MTRLRALKVDALRKKCKSLGLSTSGTKAQLIERLEEGEDFQEEFASMCEDNDSLRARVQQLEQSLRAIETRCSTPAKPNSFQHNQNIPKLMTSSSNGQFENGNKVMYTNAAENNMSSSKCAQASQITEPTHIQPNVCNVMTSTTAALPSTGILQYENNLTGMQQYPIMSSYVRSNIEMNGYPNQNAHSQRYGSTFAQRPTLSAVPQQNILPMHSGTFNPFSNVRDIVALLPTFNPSPEEDNLDAKQFVMRVQSLKNAYGWDDQTLIFSVQQKMEGSAKFWVNSLDQIFHTWNEFAERLLTDFPCIQDEVDIHLKMSQMIRGDKESPQDYFYRMLACGKRGNLSELAIIRHIIKGINCNGLKQHVSREYISCNQLLHDIATYCRYNEIKTPMVSKMKSFPKNTPASNEKLEKKNDDSNDKGKIQEIICYNCRKPGHISAKCPETQRKPRCTICNKTNHNTNDCSQRESNVNKITKTEVMAKNQDILKTISINGHEITAFVDPGSDSTLVKESYADRFGNISPCVVNLKGFGGGQHVCKQKVNVEIQIDENTFNVDMLIVDDSLLTQDVLLGKNVLCKKGKRLVIDETDCWVENVNCITSNDRFDVNEVLKLQELLTKYRNCFADKVSELGKCNTVLMEITTTSKKPVNVKPYRLPFAQRSIVKEIVKEWLQNDIVRPSNSPYASGVVLVKKKNGEYRLCIDYRQLNKITQKIPFPMPNIEEQFAQLAGNKYFTSLDLRMGYHQIEMAETSKKYTAFVTTEGHYEYNRMPFGLVNAPSVFQNVMNKLVDKMEPGSILSYLDDIIIVSKSIPEGIERLGIFFEILQRNGLKLCLAKCKFLQTEISHLGHIVNGNGVTPGVEKVSAIRNFPTPTSITEVRRYLGLTGFFRKFVENYSMISKPLTKLLCKSDTPEFVWGEQQQKAFEKLQEKLCNRPVLALYDFNASHEVHTDASAIGLGGVLLQSTDERRWQPVCYFSRHCTEAESKFHSYELEILAVVETLQRFRIYVLGKRFRLVTDCSAIAKIKATKELIPKIARWWVKIMDYDCEIVHRQAHLLSHVDALSRSPDLPPKEVDPGPNVLRVSINADDWILTMQLQDATLREIMSILANETKSDQVKQLKKDYCIRNHRLYRRVGDDVRFVVPKNIRWRIVEQLHDDMGHFGVEKTVERIKKKFWFPNVRKYVKNYISGCISCCYNKAKGGRTEARLHLSEIVPVPFQTIHLDHLGPFVRSRGGYMYVLAISDAFSKFLIVRPVKTTKTQPVLQVLNDITGIFGLPKQIITDRGTSYTSKLFEDFCETNDICHVKTAVRTPRANGQVERANQTILSYLRTSTVEKNDWDKSLRDLQWVVNSQKNTTTGFAPNDLVFNFNLRDIVHNYLIAAVHDDVCTNDKNPLDIDEKRKQAVENAERERKKWKDRFDNKHANPTSYNEGDMVVVENEPAATGESKKLEPAYKGPYIIGRVLGNDRYLLEDIPGMQVSSRKFCSVFAADKIKRWCSSPDIEGYEEWSNGIEDDSYPGMAELSADEE